MPILEILLLIIIVTLTLLMAIIVINDYLSSHKNEAFDAHEERDFCSSDIEKIIRELKLRPVCLPDNAPNIDNLVSLAKDYYALNNALFGEESTIKLDENNEKRLKSKLRRIWMYLDANHIEIDDYIGRDYNEGLNVEVNDYVIEKGVKKPFISKVWRPEIRYCGIIKEQASVNVTKGSNSEKKGVKNG